MLHSSRPSAVGLNPYLNRGVLDADALGKGDVLVIAEWDRATRSMMDGVAIIERIHARGAMIKVLDKPHLDLTTSIGRAAARKLGARFGRKPKLTQHQQAEAKQRLAKGDTCRGIARSFNVHHATISRLA